MSMNPEDAELQEWEEYMDSLWEELRAIREIRTAPQVVELMEELLSNVMSYQETQKTVLATTHPPLKGVH